MTVHVRGEDMPQVFGADQLGLMSMSSLWVEAASERDIERATNPQVANEARSRGLVPLRMGADPIWHHPETGRSFSLAPAHSGDSKLYTRINNDISDLRRNLPTADETARAARTPEQVEADQTAAANETKNKKQQAVDAARRRREQDALKVFRAAHAPFKSMDEVQRAYDARSERVKASRPNDTVDQFAGRLRELAPEQRQQIHKIVFPERY